MNKELTPEQISIINDMTMAWVDDPIRHRQAFRDDCRRLIATCYAKPPVLDAALLRKMLSYDSETGVFRWLVRANKNTVIGSVAGCVIGNGYYQIRMLGKQNFYGHRLAYLYMMGEWPPEQIDHRDGDPTNNRWNNLRVSDQTQNMGNTCTPSHNTSGHKGVSWCKKRKKWRAYVVFKKKQTSLGYFTHKHDAAAAYAIGAKRTFGEFARVA